MDKGIRNVLIQLNEEKMSDEVYKNPTWSEIELVGELDGRDMIKFVANHRKQTFFIAPFDVAHYEILQYTDVSGRGNDVFFGNASIKGRNLDMRKIPSKLVEGYILEGKYDYLSEYGFDMREYKRKLQRFLDSIDEKFYKGFGKSNYREIFINPSFKEMKSAAGDVGSKGDWVDFIRFFAFFDTKDVYVWSGDVLHPDIRDEIDRNFSDNYIEGIAEIRGNKAVISRDRMEDLDDELMGYAYDNILNGNLDYLDRYRFDILELKEEIKRNFNENNSLFERVGKRIDSSKMKKYLTKFDNAEDFKENGVRAGIGGVRVSELLGYINKNSTDYLDKSKIRKELADGGQYYFLYEVDPRKLDIQDKGDLEIDSYDKESLEKPIVVGDDYFIIDGRHRALVAMKEGMSKINAYLSPKVLYRELMGYF